jgi:hypothetical protein
MAITGENLSVQAIWDHLEAERRAAAQKAADHAAEAAAEQEKLRADFMERDILPEAKDRLASLIRKAIEAGEREAMVLRFPSAWLPDQGRGVANHDEGWVEKLEGFPRRAFEFFKEELEPQGFQLRAQILEYPDGIPGDVGFFLGWKRPEEM